MIKRTYLLILAGFIFLLPSFTHAQNNSFFTVFVGNYPDPQAEQFSLLKRYGFLYKEDLQQNISKVYLGGFDNRKEALALLNKIKPLYTEAAVVEQKYDPKNEVSVIQIATRVFTEGIQWQDFEQLDNLYMMINGDKIKIATGIYSSFDAARQDLDAIRAMGFKDAFIKNVNGVLLKKLSEFETGLKKPLIPIQLDNRPVAVSQPPQRTSVPRPKTVTPPAKGQAVVTRQPSSRGYESMIPMKGQSSVQPKSPQGYDDRSSYQAAKGGISQPDIRSQVKRASVLELQKVLRLAGTYDGDLDGYYGPGTTAGYQKIQQQNRDLQKYSVLSEYTDVAQADMRPLQQAINSLPTEPSASNVVAGSNEAIAKAYQAYSLFGSLGPTNEVNLLMNSAIKQAYNNAQTQGPAPFDYTATYAYNDWNQLVLHLLYIHGAPANSYAAPCWLIQEHPEVSAQAQSTFANMNTALPMQNCDRFMEWDEVKMLIAIANDMNGNQQPNPQEAASDASLRAQLYTTNASLENANQASYERWNRELWVALNQWSMSDPLHQRMVTSLKVAYFQSQIRLEDFFMDKGFKYEDASGLALATIETLVGRDLKRFLQ
jgi:peptidoglycan hydrolase-like protein with peptidoglycan-binding domain